MMQELGQEVSVKTIAKFYNSYSQRIFIDSSDESESNELNDLGFEVHIADLIMNNVDKKNALAKRIIDELESK
jgi:DNA-directed RNA polymerase subunit N (RpoN/RPB10)